MLGEKFRRCSLCLLLVAALTFASCPVVTATTIEEAQKKDKELKEKKKQTQADKQALSEQLNTLIAQMADTEKKLSAKQEEIQKAEEDLVAAKVKENDQYNSMKLRIRYMYEYGDFSLMSAFFEAQSITDLLNRVEYASEMSDYDRQMLESYKEVVRKIAEQEAKLKEQYAALEVLQDQLTAQRDQVQVLLAEKEMQLADLEKEIGANAAELDKLIKQAEAAKKAREEAAAAAAAAAKSRQASTGGNPGAPKITGHGQFTHPCPGTYLSSGFGYRSFDHSFHKGYDFASHGQSLPTYAAADGTVIIAGWSNSAGNWVVINHGNGLVTKYMHHAALYVHAGETVKKGQNIGMSGTTGYSSGVHLHFQVEVNGTAVDPGSFL